MELDVHLQSITKREMVNILEVFAKRRNTVVKIFRNSIDIEGCD